MSTTLNITAMFAAGITLDELFNATPERLKELFELFPGPEVEIVVIDHKLINLPTQ